jgi:hypothetical protein
MASDSGVVGFFGDKHGRPNQQGNDHLTGEQRAELERQADETARARGAHQAIVIVNVYENGEATPSVTFPRESTIDMHDRSAVDAVVAQAAEALQRWN